MRGADPLAPRPARIVGRREETADTFTLELEVPGGLVFDPGQFNMLYLFGLGEVPISISGDPARPERTVHTIRSVGTVTRGMAGLKTGDVLGLRGPYGTAWPVEEARGRDVIVMAGGIGLAPLRPVIYAVRAEPEAFGRLHVLYGARTPADLLYPDELDGWVGDPAVHLAVTVDRGVPGWTGAVGVVTELCDAVTLDPDRSVAMLCGPEVMMRFGARTLIDLGVPAAAIWLSMERNMKCATGFCGHCQWGPHFVCRDGAVLRYDRIADLLPVREM